MIRLFRRMHHTFRYCGTVHRQSGKDIIVISAALRVIIAPLSAVVVLLDFKAIRGKRWIVKNIVGDISRGVGRRLFSAVILRRRVFNRVMVLFGIDMPDIIREFLNFPSIQERAVRVGVSDSF